MAIMIPSVLSPDVKSSAERRVFEWFQSAPHTDNWIVLHSLGITTHNRVIYGETDFFVLAPHLGVFALEVKGGRVKRANGIWYFTDKYDNVTSKARGPFTQARDSVFSIVSALKERIDYSHRHLSDVFFGYGVMFPDIAYTAAGIDEEQWQVFDENDGCNVRSFIERLASGAKAKWESIYGTLDPAKLPAVEDIRYLASILRGDFDCAISINTQLRNADNALITLTKEQYFCLDQLDDNPRCLIQGPAGTGKTLLAIEEVKKTAALGAKVALFCFNTNLAEWLKCYFSGVSPLLRPAYVGTLHKYMALVTKKAGNAPVYPRDPDVVPQYYQESVPEAALKALGYDTVRFDKIVIDEAQDLIRDSYLRLLDACLQKGLSRGRWTMYGDFSMQAIYTDGISGQGMKKKLEEYTSFIHFKLTINCRNTKPICEEIKTVTGLYEQVAMLSKVDGPPVQYITWSTMDQQCTKLKELLAQLYESQIYPEKITILSPRKRQNSVVSLLEGYSIKEFRVPFSLHTTFSTIHAYKGLENTVVILTDIEDFTCEKLMYIGLSRARSGLFVMISDDAAKEYNSLLVRRLLND